MRISVASIKESYRTRRLVGNILRILFRRIICSVTCAVSNALSIRDFALRVSIKNPPYDLHKLCASQSFCCTGAPSLAQTRVYVCVLCVLSRIVVPLMMSGVKGFLLLLER